MTTEPVELQARFAPTVEVIAQERDLPASLQAAIAWHAEVVYRTLQMNRRGRFSEARHYLRGQRGHFGRYCNGVPGTEKLVWEMERLYEEAGRDWGESSRKELSAMMTKRSRSEAEYRAEARSRSVASYIERMPPRLPRRPSHEPGATDHKAEGAGDGAR